MINKDGISIGQTGWKHAIRICKLERISTERGHFARNKAGEIIQIVSRSLIDPWKSGMRTNNIHMNQEWDKVMLVVMYRQENYKAAYIRVAERKDVEAIRDDEKPSEAVNPNISKFNKISKEIYRNKI